MSSINYIVAGIGQSGISVLTEALKAGGFNMETVTRHSMLDDGDFPNVPGVKKVMWVHRHWKAVADSLRERKENPIKTTTEDVHKMEGQAIVHIFSLEGFVSPIQFVDYDSLVLNPIQVFYDLIVRGWDIDPVAAARTIDPHKNHHWKEEPSQIDIIRERINTKPWPHKEDSGAAV